MRSGEVAAERLYRQMDFEKKLFDLDETYFKCSETEKNFIITLLYLLYIDTEFHAEAASVFADLYSFNGNIRKHKLDAFNRCNELEMGMNLLQYMSDETYMQIKQLLKCYHRSMDKCRTVVSFKRHFIRETRQRLDMFRNKIETIYDFYYNFKREHDAIKNTSVSENAQIYPWRRNSGRWKRQLD